MPVAFILIPSGNLLESWNGDSDFWICGRAFCCKHYMQLALSKVLPAYLFQVENVKFTLNGTLKMFRVINVLCITMPYSGTCVHALQVHKIYKIT